MQPASSEGEPPAEGRGAFGWVRRFSRLWGLLLLLGLVLLLFRRVVLPFVFGALIAYLLEPVVRRIAPKLGRGLAVIVVYVLLLGVMVGFFGGLLPGVFSDLSKLRESTPAAVQTFEDEWLPKASAWFEETFPSVLADEEGEQEQQISEVVIEPRDDGSYRVDLQDVHLDIRESGGGWVVETDAKRKDSFGDILRDIVASKGDELTEVAANVVRGIVTGIANFLTDFVIAFLVAALLLIDLQRVQRFVRSLVPPDHHGAFDELAEGIEEGMAGVVRGQILICIINGALAYVGLLVFGVHYALLLAMIAAILSIIPVVGVLIATIPLLGVALVSGDLGLEGLALGKSAAMLLWLVGIHLLEANYLNPKIIGVAANIHPIVLLFALLAGFEVGGLVGALLAIPVASVFQTVFLYARRHSQGARPGKPRSSSSGTGWSTPELRASLSSSRLVQRELSGSDGESGPAAGPDREPDPEAEPEPGPGVDPTDSPPDDGETPR